MIVDDHADLLDIMPSNEKYNVLLVIEQCNPDWPSVPLVGYKFFSEIDKISNVTLVTHERNRNGLTNKGHHNVVYISESKLMKGYYKLVNPFMNKVWALYHSLSYPIYAEFNRRVYAQFRQDVSAGKYDVVHALTPMIPRYPVKISKACENTPFLLGPVNGGIPYPAGFQNVSVKEYGYLNFLRGVGRALIPGYKRTYQSANRVLSGSSYTLGMLKEMFALPQEKLELFYENGVDQESIDAPRDFTITSEKFQILFVGRLVPYKGADMLVEAISRLRPEMLRKIQVTIVGDGPERKKLETQVDLAQLREQIQFTGWIKQEATKNYYRAADIFCFPSVREFGGAVVLEAMAAGLPCVVIDHGGIGEYVTAETGIKITPTSREFVIKNLMEAVCKLCEDQQLLRQYSTNATKAVRKHSWNNKALEILHIYDELIDQDTSSNIIQDL